MDERNMVWVVRCAKCMHYNSDHDRCKLTGNSIYPEFYCADGEWNDESDYSDVSEWGDDYA